MYRTPQSKFKVTISMSDSDFYSQTFHKAIKKCFFFTNSDFSFYVMQKTSWSS